MNKYCDANPAGCSGKQVIKSGLSWWDKQTAVNTHNELRCKLANGQEPGMSAATDMNELKYDEELAKVAQR